MFFPHSTDHQTVTNFANSAKEIMQISADKDLGRNDTLQEMFGRRVHELMRFRSHTVNTD